MIKNNRNNEQIYGRNDMIMLDPNNKIYGSLGLADKYVMKTEEGTRLVLNNPKQGRFADVLTEFNIYGRSEQFSTTGAQLLNENIEIENRGVTIKINGSTATFVGTVSDESNSRVNFQKKIKLKPGKYTASSSNEKIVADFSVKKANDETIYNRHIEIDGTEEVKIRVLFGLRPSAKGDVINETTNIMLNDGDIALPYEPYTGGKPSPSPDYPQEIKSVVNPTVKVTNEDGLKVQSVTLNNITLNAIPVSSGGNVTIDGQQWVCDEVDLERGVKVQRVKVLDVRNEILFLKGISEHYWYVSIDLHDCSLNGTVFKSYESVMCQKFQVVSQQNEVKYSYPIVAPYGHIGSTELRFRAPEVLYATIEDFQQTIVGAKVYYPLATAIEIPLTNTEIAAFNALTTYHPTTIVENNYNTWMKATYKSIESV